MSKQLPAQVVRHDVFNLVVIFMIILLTFAHLITSNMTVFWVLWWFCEFYFILDTVWVAVQPSCVKGPREIIIHHIITSLYAIVAYIEPEYSHLMCWNLMVEVNTFFLILKRHVKSPILEFLFYFTWVTMRLIAYPLMAIMYMYMYYEYGKKVGTYFSFFVLAPTIHSYLSFLNYWWTVTMLKQMREKGKKGSIDKKET